MTIPIVNGVNPLQTTLLELGIVSGRVALLLRSAEIQPVFEDLSFEWFIHSPLPPVRFHNMEGTTRPPVLGVPRELSGAELGGVPCCLHG
jgi:hypothetical protein